MAKRKTFSVDEFRKTVNSCLANMDGDSETDRAYRQGIMTQLENILHETGNYRGFNYLYEGSFGGKGRPGVNYVMENGYLVLERNYEKRFAGTDNTRVAYY